MMKMVEEMGELADIIMRSKKMARADKLLEPEKIKEDIERDY